MRFVQLTLTDEQAALTHQALIARLNDPAELASDEEEEKKLREALSSLVYFFWDINEHPEKYGPTGEVRATLGRLIRRKGPSQPKPNKRKRAQLRAQQRQGGQKRTRAQRREEAKAYNEARERMEADEAEAERIHEENKARAEALLKAETLAQAELDELLTLLDMAPVVQAAEALRAA